MAIRLTLALLLAFGFALTHAACSGDAADSGSSAADHGSSSDTQPPEGFFVGKVTETMDSGGYTYVKLTRGEESVWAAGPVATVEIGEELGVSTAMKMPNFRSETLDRTFEELYFVGMFERDDHTHDADGGHSTPEAVAAHGGAGSMAGGRGAPATELDLGGIEKADGGHTVAELWAEKASLAGKEVVLRGRVVKYNGGIMGRNWLHVQDGSGSADANDHDITVTTDQSAKVGDLVTVRGWVSLDKDFGAGYSYALILEQAKIEAE